MRWSALGERLPPSCRSAVAAAGEPLLDLIDEQDTRRNGLGNLNHGSQVLFRLTDQAAEQLSGMEFDLVVQRTANRNYCLVYRVTGREPSGSPTLYMVVSLVNL